MKLSFSLTNRKSFTLVELLTVIAVIAVLVTMALPNLTFFIEKMKAQEMVPVLLGVYHAQKEHLSDTGKYANLGNPNTKLSDYIYVPPSQYFDLIAVTCGQTASICFPFPITETGCTGPAIGYLAVVKRTAPLPDVYSLFLFEDGSIGCAKAGSCLGFCERLGFEPF